MSLSVTTTTTFEAFRSELDEHYDRRERLIKTSRDVTNLSKKIIFLIHRIMSAGDGSASKAVKSADEKLTEIMELFAAMSKDITGNHLWRYQYNYSPGLQEFIEALSLKHYLETGKLISFNQVKHLLVDKNGVYLVPLDVEDYLLGVSDLTGELMRMAISGIARKGGRTQALSICSFVRSCLADLEVFAPNVKNLPKKQEVSLESLRKIEQLVYNLKIRESEYDLSPEKLEDFVAMSVVTYGSGPSNDHDR